MDLRYHSRSNSIDIFCLVFQACRHSRRTGWDILHVDGITYISERSAGIDIPYNRSDRGNHIGVIKSGDYTFHIYEVKGDPDRNYLYWAWEWEGEMYVREDLADAMKEQEG